MNIERIDYNKKISEMSNFEIVDLQLFFSTRSHKMLKKDYRLNFWVIMYVIEGRGKHYIDFKPYEYESGSIIFIRKNQVHHFEVNHDVKGFMIHINEPFMLKLDYFNSDFLWDVINSGMGSPVISTDINESSNSRKLIEMLYGEYCRFVEKKDEDLIKCLFESFILTVRSGMQKPRKKLSSTEYSTFKKFSELVEEHYLEHLTLDHYERMMGVSKKTINLATRKTVDMSAKQFISERLCLEIKRYLSQGDLMIYEIADILGFDEPANMTKFFKRFENQSPKEFREVINR